MEVLLDTQEQTERLPEPTVGLEYLKSPLCCESDKTKLAVVPPCRPKSRPVAKKPDKVMASLLSGNVK